MELAPRYGSDAVIVLDGDPAGIGPLVVAQRRRLLAALELFDDDQWTNPSRCAGWSSRDVVEHLAGTNGFWAHSIDVARRGEPSRLLAGFDPAVTPAQMVAGAADLGNAEVLERFATSTARLIDAIGAVEGDEWLAPAEAPPGHLTLSAVAHHALWDSWVHERDVLLPLGVVPVVVEEEVTACLRYAAALAPAIAILLGEHRRGRVIVAARAPDVSFEVRVDGRAVVRGDGAARDDDTRDDDARDDVDRDDGARNGAVGTGDELTLTGDAVTLVEALSVRRPYEEPPPERSAWLVDGLRHAFSTAI